MSTKNLARTVIEGGRGRSSWPMRRSGHHADRALARQALGRAQRGADLDALVIPVPRRNDTWFNDKLAPAQRWLASQAGRPWDLVRGELFQLFDTRTTAGRHVVYCHMLDWVECKGHSRRGRFHVDAGGTLRLEVDARPRRRWPALPRPECELLRWLGGRRVGERGPALFWFVLTAHGAFRQHHRLAEADARLWRSLPAEFRKHHDPSAPLPRN